MRAQHYIELIEDLMTLEDLHLGQDKLPVALTSLEEFYYPRIFKKDHFPKFQKYADSM
ncbi:MAG TPA: hypothetical protein V6C52_00655 [Coleofasciculaceae cyanobacterium]